MILDAQNLFSDQQNLAQAAGTYNSTNVIDLGVTGSIPQGGSPISDPGRAEADLLVQVTTAFTTSASGTLTVQLVNADDAGLSTNATVLTQSATLAVATLTAGYKVRIPSIPPGATQRYLGLKYVIGTGAMTAGNITAGLVIDKQTNPTV